MMPFLLGDQEHEITYNLLELDVPDPEKLVVIDESGLYPGELVFQTFSEQSFLRQYSRWVSARMCLSNLFNLPAFVRLLQEDGWQVVWAGGCVPIVSDYNIWCHEVQIDGFQIPRGGQLYPFQHFTINRALARCGGQVPSGRLFFVGWCAGAGKSLMAVAGARELFNQGMIERVLVFTTNANKINLARVFTTMGSFADDEVFIPEGTPRKRNQMYDKAGLVYSLNYEKARFDMAQLKELTAGRKTLIVMDECQHVLAEEGATKTRRCLDEVVACTDPIVWPMSASVVGASPLRYRDVFSLAGAPRSNPLGTKKDFTERYSARVYVKEIPIPGRRDPLLKTVVDWDDEKLAEVRHRVADRAQNVRKTDPGVAELFKDMSVMVEPVQMGERERQLYGIVSDWAEEADAAGDPIAHHYFLMRHLCNTPEALPYSDSQIARDLLQRFPGLCKDDGPSAKFEAFLDKVEGIAEAGDKVVGFTAWTEMSLLRLVPHLNKRGIRHVVHYGQGQSQAESQAAQDRFKADPSITLFLSSDAGKEGLNFQEARYVINLEPTYSWDTMMQRTERINRADSYLDGLCCYTLVTDDTVESRVWDICDQRRQLAEATLGTSEALSTVHQAELDNLKFLIFGKR